MEAKSHGGAHLVGEHPHCGLLMIALSVMGKVLNFLKLKRLDKMLTLNVEGVRHRVLPGRPVVKTLCCHKLQGAQVLWEVRELDPMEHNSQKKKKKKAQNCL